jgi:hypothetical protein
MSHDAPGCTDACPGLREGFEDVLSDAQASTYVWTSEPCECHCHTEMTDEGV